VLLLPELSRIPIEVEIAIIFTIHLLSKIGLENRTLESIFENYLVVIEGVTLVVTLWLSRRVARSLINFEDAIDKSILDVADFTSQDLLYDIQHINEVLLRARRYKYTVSLIYLEFCGLPALKNSLSIHWNREKRLENRYLRTYIVKVLKELLLDDSDIITWHKNNLVLCLPEKTLADTTEFVHNLEELFRIVFEVNIQTGVATFPGDALVAFDLLEVSSARMKEKGSTQLVGLKYESGLAQSESDQVVVPQRETHNIIGETATGG
jgi:hypothetical protein